MQNELWKPVPETGGILEVSNLGSVKSKDRVRRNSNKIIPGRIMPQPLSGYGYPEVFICIDGVDFRERVHRLVAKAFVPGYFEGACVDHVDCDKLNNRADNLEWVSIHENSRRSHMNGLIPYFAKVPDLKAHAVRLLYQHNFPPLLLAEWFGVSESYVRLVSVNKPQAKALESRRKPRIIA